jgi:serine/threonine protein phosphatase PrpC
LLALAGIDKNQYRIVMPAAFEAMTEYRANGRNLESVSKLTKDLLYMMARLMVNDGMGIHPSNKGHEQMADAMVAALENNYTGEDFVNDQVPVLAKFFRGFLRNDEVATVEQKLNMIFVIFDMMGDGFTEMASFKTIIETLKDNEQITDEQAVDIIAEAFGYAGRQRRRRRTDYC